MKSDLQISLTLAGFAITILFGLLETPRPVDLDPDAIRHNGVGIAEAYSEHAWEEIVLIRSEVDEVEGSEGRAERIQVMDKRGRPIAGAWVAARLGKRTELWPRVPAEDQMLASAQTDADGWAELGGLPNGGEYELAAWAAGYELQSLPVKHGKRVDGGEVGLGQMKFALDSGRDVDLRVVDHRGQPVVGAEVRLQVGEASQPIGGCVVDYWGPLKPIVAADGFYQGYAQRAKTDESGTIRFASVPYEAGEIRWLHPGYVNSGDLTLNAYTTSTTIRADPGVIVHPRIVKADGTALLGGRVHLVSQREVPRALDEDGDGEVDSDSRLDGEFNSLDPRITASRDVLEEKWVRAVVSRADGEIELTGLPDQGWYYLQVEYHGMLFDTPWRRIEDRRPVIQMPPFHEVRGQIKTPQNAPDYHWVELSTPQNLEDLAIGEPYGDEILPRADGSFVFLLDPAQTQVCLTLYWGEDLTYHHTLTVTGHADLGEITLPPKGWIKTDSTTEVTED